MKTKKSLLTFVVALFALISGCASDDFVETVGVCPVVVSTIPAPGAIGVPLNQIISVTFNEAMNPATIQTSFTVENGTPIGGIITYSGNVATFTPSALLAANTVYTGRVKTSAKDVNGNALQVEYVWKFTTGLAPSVSSTDPSNGLTGVELNKTITATFNMAMNPATLVDPATTFTVKQGATIISGVVTYSGLIASFNPTIALTAGKEYTCTISTAAKNVAGVPMVSDYVWKFTTGIAVTGGTIPPAASAITVGALGGNAGITNQGLFTRINNGGIATTGATTTITGFTDLQNGTTYTVTGANNGLVQGGIHAADTTADAELLKANDAYNSISPASKPGGIDPGAGELGSLTLAPGIYKAASGTFKITNGDLTLDAQGDPNAVWIFQTAAALTVGDSAPSSVKLIGGALAKNVYWYVGSTAVINYAGGGVMVGTIIANSGVTLSSPANNTNAVLQTVLNGKAISLVSSVTMVNTIINVQ